jgi:hypothetical protein
MSKPRKSTIEVQGTAITILSRKEQDFISLFGQTARQWRDANPKLEGNNMVAICDLERP